MWPQSACLFGGTEPGVGIRVGAGAKLGPQQCNKPGIDSSVLTFTGKNSNSFIDKEDLWDTYTSLSRCDLFLKYSKDIAPKW